MNSKIAYMIFAVLMAILLWFQVNLFMQQETMMEIPIRIVNIPENLYLYRADQLRIPLRVKGSGLDILRFQLSGQTIDYNGADVVMGENALDISKINSSMQTYTRLTFSPSSPELSITFYTDQIHQKRVPVIFDFYTDADRRTLIENQYIFDDVYVTVSGPTIEIADIQNVLTEKISSDIIRTRIQSIRIASINDHIIIVPASIDLMKASDIVTTRTISSIPIYHDAEHLTIFPQRVTVKLEGKQDILNALTPEDIQAFIYSIDYQDNQNTDVQIKVPNSVKIIDFTPNQVNVRLIAPV